MKLSAKSKKIQESILDSIKKNLPLAGLLASAAIMTGCDPKDPYSGAVMGKMILGDKDSTNTTETMPDTPVTPGEPPVPTNAVPSPPAGIPPPVEATMGEISPTAVDIKATNAQPQATNETLSTEVNK